MRAVLPHLHEGGLLGTFIDWRGYPTANAAATKLGLAPLNLIVWAKTNGGMGSLYRSQHELLPLFKKGSAPHINNVELGRRGRWRSNVWTYPGASSLGSDARRCLKDHPTVKPTAMRLLRSISRPRFMPQAAQAQGRAIARTTASAGEQASFG